jgi:hypothetical protein
MIRDTVFFDTPARRAMSLMVAAFPDGMRPEAALGGAAESRADM